MDKFYLFDKELSDAEIISVYKQKIESSKMYDLNLNSDLLTYNRGYLIYSFVEGSIKNVKYLIVRNNKETSGVIDAATSLSSRQFILNNLNTADFSEVDCNLADLNIFNNKDLKDSDDLFIKRLLDKITTGICKRHNLYLSLNGNELDIAPIRDFDSYGHRYYLESVYEIIYYERQSKKTYKSLYSALSNTFYEFNYVLSKEYKEFLKRFKNPVSYIPQDYRQYYYEIAFDVYLKTNEELKYLKYNELYTKLRKNIRYKGYTKYEDYLKQLIFYFKRKSYLSEYISQTSDHKEKIFYSYLTLKHNEESGYRLATYVKQNLLDDDYVRLLKISNSLGNSFAKKALFEYYSDPRFYNENYIKRYSS